DPDPDTRRPRGRHDPRRNAGGPDTARAGQGLSSAGPRRARRSPRPDAGRDPTEHRSGAGGGAAGPSTAPPRQSTSGPLADLGPTGRPLGGRPVSDRGRPLYRISAVAEMLELHPQTLRLYEKKGLIRPSRTTGRTRVYSAEDVEEIRLILRLGRELGVNLAGIEIILKMRRQRQARQQEREALAAHIG